MENSESNKFFTMKIVPWVNKEEWLLVYHRLFSDSVSECQWALGRVAAWKCKAHPNIPLGIETSAALVSARLLNNDTNKIDCENIRMVYSMAIVRFINFVSDLGQNTARNLSIQVAAEKLNIPNWLVTIRHFATHSTLPSMPLLQNGMNFALDWLYNNYWKQITFEDGTPDDSCNDKQAIADVVGSIKRIQLRNLSSTSFTTNKAELRQLRKLSKGNKVGALDILCQPSWIVLSEAEIIAIGGNSSYDEISPKLLKYAHPFLKIIFILNGIEVLLDNIVNTIESGSLDKFQTNLSYRWVITICEAYFTSNRSKALGKLAQRFQPKIDSMQVLRALVRIPAIYVKDFLPEFLAHFNLNVPMHCVEHVMKLFTVFNGHSIPSSPDTSDTSEKSFDESDLSFMIENIDSCRKKKPLPVSVDNGWKMAGEDLLWADYSIGILPDELQSQHANLNSCDVASPAVDVEMDGIIDDEEDVGADLDGRESRGEVNIDYVLKSIDDYYNVSSE